MLTDKDIDTFIDFPELASTDDVLALAKEIRRVEGMHSEAQQKISTLKKRIEDFEDTPRGAPS